jgi:hypothetical protein
VGSFVCGETLCKAAFDAEVDPARPWPVRCPTCARSLYPAEVLESTALEELDARRAPLMKRYGGKLVDVDRAELSKAKGAAKSGPSLLEEIAAEADERLARKERGSSPMLWVGAAAAVAVIALVVWLVLR